MLISFVWTNAKNICSKHICLLSLYERLWMTGTKTANATEWRIQWLCTTKTSTLRHVCAVQMREYFMEFCCEKVKNVSCNRCSFEAVKSFKSFPFRCIRCIHSQSIFSWQYQFFWKKISQKLPKLMMNK